MMAPPLIPAGLRCGHQVNPLGIAPDRVRLSWTLDGQGTSRAQRAYQVLVAQDREPLTEGGSRSWDSGLVESASSTDIPYAGKTLARGERYTGQVRVWDDQGQASGWSGPAVFEVELDAAEGWLASWIGRGRVRESVTPPAGRGPVDPVANALAPAPYLRRALAVDRPAVSARLYVTALGLYEARLNGHRIGDAFLAPGWTDYGQRVLYQTYDVTSLLTTGENVLGAVIADGWYAGFVGFDAKRAGAHYGKAPEFLAQLAITFADGSRQWVVTDDSWQSATGAIRHADLLMGERHDLRLEPAGWDVPGFDAAGWAGVSCRDRGAVALVADPGPPVRVTEEIRPVSITRDPQGRQVVDFGQNLTGWVRAKVNAPAGTSVRVGHGAVWLSNLREQNLWRIALNSLK